MVKPITPDTVTEYKLKSIPDEVFEAVNELIALKFTIRGQRVIVKQQEIIDLVRKKLYPDAEEGVKGRFDFNWLNFEKVYEEAGWTVKYDKPAYNESYDAHFEFTAKPSLRY